MPADLVTRLLLQNKEFDRNIQESRRQIQAFEKRVNAMGATVRSFVAGFAGMAGVSMAFMDITQKSMQFEKSLSSLRSLTGVSADEMDFFKQQAIKMGSTSSQTASQVVDAFKAIGSQKPELLKSKEALSEVTKQAIILAEAAGMDVPEAAKALTGSLNQMGESAGKAGEYINILAAASQAGSADIPYLTKAIEKSGGAASSVGVSYNELVAAIEAIAPKMSEASEAGTNLRNIFLTLESNADKKLKPSVVGLTKALENLAAKNLDATQMTKMFGKESVTAALAIVNAKDNYLHYKDAITGTNTALEQQKINNDNLAGSVNALSSSWEGFVLTMNQSNGVLREATDFMGALLSKATELLKSDQQKQNEIIQEGVNYRKKQLDKEIEGWMVLGDRKKAIEETMRQFNIRNPGGEEAIQQELRAEIVKLENMYSALDRYSPKTGADKALHKVVPYSFLSPADVASKNKLEEQIKSQKEILSNTEVKNELYKASVKYLQDELAATNKIKEANNKTGVAGVTDDMRKGWKEMDAKEKRELSFEESSLHVGESIRAEFAKMMKEEVTIPVIFKPEYVESEELPDITGSIEDYQEQIQSVTLAYNQATTDELRALYAQQLEDLEEHLQKMTDVNQGMIDIAQEVNSLVQGSVVSAFESIGDAIASNDAGDAMRNMLMGIMDMLKQFGAALVSAGLASVAFKKLLANPYLAIAAGGALIIASTAAKAALQKSISAGSYADGGIVPYRFTVGDRMTANVNGGEMILNATKQKKLFDLLDIGRTQINNDTIRVSGRLVGSGDQIVAVLDNTAKKQRRGI